MFLSTLNQIAFLFGFIIIGYALIRFKVVPENSAMVLSKLENYVFIPALVAGTFIENFTVEKINSAGKLMAISFVIGIIVIIFAIIISKVITKDKYTRNIYTYGLSFSNFGFMGNAVVMSLFPEIFFEYLIFTLPLWIYIYLWGVPRLLISDSEKKQTLKDSLKSFINPMFIAMIVGMVIGLSNISVPSWITSIVDVSADCMSPVAMLLTGVVVAAIPLKKTFSNIRNYVVSVIRLVVMPLAFVGVCSFFELPDTIYICALCSLAMPLGLNPIVIPSALGKDTTDAAGMTIISHLLSSLTIPFIFLFVK